MQPLEATDPDAVGGYPLLARLGAGGMGQVYLSRTPAGRPLALKTVRPDLAAAPDFEPRFAREIRSSDRVRSPWTVSVVDFSRPGHRPQWLATEYVAAPSLAEWVMAHGPLPPAALRALAAELAAALGAVHACGLTHRDVKPSNILLARERPMLIDFGIARAADDSRHTRTGGVIGSPGYLAPEQVSGGVVTDAGDVFSLAAVLVYAATGDSPFQHPGEDVSAASLLYRVVHDDPRLDGVPDDLVPVLRRCLAKQPEHRPGSAELTGLLPRERESGGWEHALPPGLQDDLTRRAAEVSALCATAPATVPPPPPPLTPPVRAGAAATPPMHPGAVAAHPVHPVHHPGAVAAPPPAAAHRRRRTARTVVAVTAGAVAATTAVLLLRPFGDGDGEKGTGADPTSGPTASTTTAALSRKWEGVWTGEGPGNPDADGRLQPRTDSFVVTLTLHTAAKGDIAGKQVSEVSEVGTRREVGCTEALELRGVRGSTATFEAVTSHPTDRSNSSLTCEKGHVYVVQLTADDTLRLGEEGAQSAGAPSELRRAPGTD
ncbi:serine/threonine-protein kinase [Streptomyces sp. NPDC000345]|uniref:serine/threonine-protein kinase n=1 Tax=Streptomyces sp. NPDC000345 TaxID=3364537 RepID=UPI0036AC53B0